MATSVKRNAMAKMSLNILNIVLPLVTGPYVARVLDSNLFGEYNKAFSILSWFLPFASFGIYNYGIRIISQNKNDKEKTRKIFTQLFIMGCISTIIVFFIYLLFVLFKPNKVNNLIYIVLSIQIIANIFMVEWMNEAFESYGFILFKTMIVRLFNVFSIFIFIRKSDDIVSYAMITSIVVLLNNILSYFHIKKHVSFEKINIGELKNLIKPLCIMLLLANASMFYTYLDKLYLSIFSKGIYVTYYTFSQAITGLVINVISSLVIVTIPRLSRYLSEKDDEEYIKLLFSSSRIFFMIGIPMCIGISVLGKEIMLLYAGEEYLGAGLTLSLFSLRYIMGMCDLTLANQVIFVHGEEKRLAKLYFIGGITNLILNSLLVMLNLLSPELLIITTFISEVLLIILMNKCIRKNINKRIHVMNKYTVKYLLTSFMFFFISGVLSKVLNIQYVIDIRFIINIAIIIITCVTFYISVLFITKDCAFFEIVDIVMRRFKFNRKE